MSLLKDLKKGFEDFGKTFKTTWINPGYCRWHDKPKQNAPYLNGLNILGWNKRNIGGMRGTGRKLAIAKTKLIVVGALTLPVGLPVLLVTLPILFFYKGLPHLRTKYLDKLERKLTEGW